MPLIEVKMIEGVFTTSKKKEIITKLTDAMVSIEGENLRPYTLVVLEEVRSGDWGVGGEIAGNGRGPGYCGRKGRLSDYSPRKPIRAGLLPPFSKRQNVHCAPATLGNPNS